MPRGHRNLVAYSSSSSWETRHMVLISAPSFTSWFIPVEWMDAFLLISQPVNYTAFVHAELSKCGMFPHCPRRERVIEIESKGSPSWGQCNNNMSLLTHWQAFIIPYHFAKQYSRTFLGKNSPKKSGFFQKSKWLCNSPRSKVIEARSLSNPNLIQLWPSTTFERAELPSHFDFWNNPNFSLDFYPKIISQSDNRLSTK